MIVLDLRVVVFDNFTLHFCSSLFGHKSGSDFLAFCTLYPAEFGEVFRGYVLDPGRARDEAVCQKTGLQTESNGYATDVSNAYGPFSWF